MTTMKEIEKKWSEILASHKGFTTLQLVSQLVRWAEERAYQDGRNSFIGEMAEIWRENIFCRKCGRIASAHPAVADQCNIYMP